MSLFEKKRKQNNGKKKSLPNHIFYKQQREAPRFICRASFTVEAAIVIPLLTSFFVAILFFFRVLEVQMQVHTGLEITGRKLAVYAGILPHGEVAENVAGIAAAKVQLQKELAEKENLEEWIAGGKDGISLLRSKMDGEYIELVATYQIKIPLNLLDPLSASVVQKVKVRKWTGWKPGEEEESDPWVYITESGTVYHMTKSCSYLDLSVQDVLYAELERKRSYSGAIYYACPLCVTEGEEKGSVYITNYGNRYHTKLDCSGIKRTIYTVRLSQVEDKKMCSKCGNLEN